MRARKKATNTSLQYLLTYAEAAERYACSQNTVKKMAQQADAVVHLGKSARIITNKLDKYLCEIAG